MKIQIKIHAIMKSWNVCKKHEIYDKSMQNQSQKASQRGPGRPKRAQRRPRDVQKAPKCVKEGSRRRKCRFSRVLQLKMGAQRHPRGGQGVQNEPRGVAEASKRRPRASSNKYTSLENVCENAFKNIPASMKYIVKTDIALNVPKPEKHTVKLQ